MTSFTPQETQDYSNSLSEQIQVLSNHQSQTNNHVVKSNLLLTSLAKLKSELQNATKLDWYKQYISVYESYFFDQLLLQYTSLIKKNFILFWKKLNINDQMEASKLSDKLYRIPNLRVLTSDNFENLVGNKFITNAKIWAKFDKIEFSYSREYKPSLGVNQHDFRFIDIDEDTSIFLVFAYADRIEIQLELGFKHNSVLDKYLVQLFGNISEQQQKAF